MKATGIVRKIDRLGRIVLPKEMRRALDINEGTPIEVFVEDNKIILRKYSAGCLLCGEVSGVLTYKSQHICNKCLLEIGMSIKS